MRCPALLSVLLLAGSILPASAWAQTGIITLGPEEIVKAKGQEIVVPGYSVPSLADWNGDHLQDLIVGEGGSGFAGKIRVYLNVGTEKDPCFADFFYARTFSQDLVFNPDGRMGCFPRVIDWYQDLKDPSYQGGRVDLLVGLADGTVKVFVNTGTKDSPSFESSLTVGVGSPYSTPLDVGAGATSVLLDWNNDGMLDIVAGGLDGKIHVYDNCGCGGYVPPRFYSSFYAGDPVKANGGDLLVPSGHSSPAIWDPDGDGKKDILTGNIEGQILFYRNIGTDAAPVFAGYTLVQSNGRPIDLPNGPAGGLCSRPAVCHWTGAKDSTWDLLVGYGDGKIRLYRGITVGDFDGSGALDAGDFTMLVRALNQPRQVGGSPCDLNKDGWVDDLDLHLFVNLWLAEYGADKK